MTLHDCSAVFNLPPKQWINNRRLERTFTLLVNSDISVTEVCNDAGFSNLARFIQPLRNKY